MRDTREGAWIECDPQSVKMQKVKACNRARTAGRTVDSGGGRSRLSARLLVNGRDAPVSDGEGVWCVVGTDRLAMLPADAQPATPAIIEIT